MSIDIVIIGALGRMGTEIAQIVLSDSAVRLAGVVEYATHPLLGQDYGTLIGKGSLGINVQGNLESIDISKCVIIDFSSPKSTSDVLNYVQQKKCAGVVVGTTGLTEVQLEIARKASKTVPVIVSPNMSLGVNLLFLLTELVSNRLKDDFDIEIIEAHHRFKKDAPSGTAKRLGEIVAKSLDLPYDQAIKNGREGISEDIRSNKEVGMHAVRGGDIVGDHTVLFAGIGERVELRHMAHSRSTFARGAVITAKWIGDKGPGLYSMRDVLGL